MSSLSARKEGILWLKTFDENKKENKFEEIQPSIEDNILLFLNSTIELVEDFTVRDWFKLVKRYKYLQKLDGFMESYLQEYDKCAIENCKDPDSEVYEIQFKKIIEYGKYTKDDKYDCEIYIDITGKAKDVTYSLSFWEIGNYLDLPIKLLSGCSTIHDYTKSSSEPFALPEEINITYTLFDFITSFIWEISFYGTPEATKEENNKLKEMVKQIDSGEMKTYPIDDLFKEEEEKHDP